MDNIDKEIEAAEASYNSGDFKSARKTCEKILETGELDKEISRRADRILAATGIDPIAKIVFAITFFLLIFLTYKYIFH